MIRFNYPKFMEFAHQVAKIPGVKKMFSGIYWYFIKNTYYKSMNQNMGIYALDVLREFDEILVNNSINYSACAGTLLGAVREHGFIKHDLDIDVVIWNKDYSPNLQCYLENAGFALKKRYLVDNGDKGREETYEKNGVGIDIFYAYEDLDGTTYLCDFCTMLPDVVTPEGSMKKYGRVATRRLNLPFEYKFIRVPFETIQVNIMENYDKWLKERYGDDYMTPNPSFEDKPGNPNIFVWEDVISTYWWKH